MPVNVAIVGPQGAGKTTLFNALTSGRGADGVGMVDIPDERLERLATAVKPKKTTPAQVRVEDTPPGSRAQRVAFARQADVLVKVARCFGPDAEPVAESLLPGGGEAAAKVAGVALSEHAPSMVLSAKLEAELGELDPAEQAEMRAGYGIDESGLGRIARAVWEAGGLITYFTAGEPEVRAWPCERDAPAPVAASKIHTDFEKHFIRAEVTSVDELVAAGSMDALRAAGKLRVEGRDYRVKDGDVIFFRIGR